MATGARSQWARNSALGTSFSASQMEERDAALPDRLAPRTWLAAGLALWIVPDSLTTNTGHAAFTSPRTTSDFITSSVINQISGLRNESNGPNHRFQTSGTAACSASPAPTPPLIGPIHLLLAYSSAK